MSVETAIKVPSTLFECLQNQTTKSLYKEYLAAEFSNECLSFIDAVDAYQTVFAECEEKNDFNLLQEAGNSIRGSSYFLIAFFHRQEDTEDLSR